MKFVPFASAAFRSLACMSVLGLASQASLAATPASISGDGTVPDPIFRTDTATFAPVRDYRYQTEGISSSTDAVEEERASLSADVDAGSGYQPPPGRRRSYGRSRYEDRMHNSDGSTKIAFMAGAGMNVPVGNTGKFYTPSYDVAVGAGYNFNKMLGVLAEFHYDHAGLTGGAIAYEYQNLQNYYSASAADLAGFDGNSHVLSLTVNPVLSFSSDRGSRLGTYFTGGVGYYHKVTNFTLPSSATACDYFCYTYSTNVNIDTASANSLGFNGGVGFTYRISDFSNERLFIEARYHWLKIASSNNTDFFPFNRRNSEYIPILVGVRF